MKKPRWLRVLALLLGLSLVAAACGDDDDTAGDDTDQTDGTTTTEGAGEGGGGGEIVDAGTFVGSPPEHLDPALNTTVNAYQVINALYDGLTDIDFSDPDNPEIVPLVAESYESNDEATEWTFTIRDDVTFSNGEQVLPSSFAGAWERASTPEFAGYYSYLFNFIEGGQAKLDGEADTISGVEADDENMTLTVRLSEPYANFDAVASFQLFMPMPTEAIEADDPGAWERDVMIGNGPYMMESAATTQEIVLVKNDDWAGDADGNTFDERPDRITFQVTAEPDTSLNALAAGEADIATIPPGRVSDVRNSYGHTLDVNLLGTYYFHIGEDERIAGEENVLLRQAIMQAIDRDEINEAVYEGARINATSMVPPGMLSYEEGLCEYCTYDEDAAREAFEQWEAEGNSLDGPLPIQFNADAGHEPVVEIIVDNLAAVGIQAEAQPMDGETYFSDLAEGACVLCRAGWIADYPSPDNFLYDLFHTESLGQNNYGYSNTEFDGLVDEAKQSTDDDEQADLYQQAERILLNDDIGAIPINWYTGTYAYDEDSISEFPYTPQGLILWERVRVAS